MNYDRVMDEKVFIGIPQHELARYSDFDACLDSVQLTNYTHKQRLFGIYIGNLQNSLVRMFLQTDFNWFWLLNDDQLYPPETLLALLSRQMDVVVPLCLEKRAPHVPLIYERGADGLHPYIFLKNGEHGLKSIGASGGGGMLIHRKVFEAIPDPWWTVQMRKAESGIIEQSSEDFDFCDKVADAGFSMWCDLDIHIVHIGQWGLRPAVDQNGDWCTMLMRNSEQIVIPAAKAPESRIVAATRTVLVPQREEWIAR